jgi:membrane protein
MNIKNVIASKRKDRLYNLVLPGFDGLPISQVFIFVVKGFRKGVLVTRASSIAFNLLMALLPSSIFIFTLIPFIPIPNFQEELIRLFEYILPLNAFSYLKTTIIDIVTHKSGGLLVIMFFATIFFSTNGIHAIIHAFVVSSHTFTTRSWLNQRKISLLLLFIVLVMFSTAGFLLIFGKMFVHGLVEMQIIRSNLVVSLLIFTKWLLVILLLFLAISFLYYFAPAKKSEFKLFSAGSILATLLFILTSLGFSAFVNNYGPYNKLYGSIGTLMVILLWLYLNSIAILIGFELNASIKEAKEEDQKKAGTQNILLSK